MYKRILSAILSLSIVFGGSFKKDVPSEAKAYIVTEALTGAVVEAKNENEAMNISGLARLMSLLIIGEAIAKGEIKLSDKISVSKDAALQKGSRVFLDAGSEYTLEELYSAAVICSANDATYAMCEHISGSEEAFVKKMNERAKALGITPAFIDCTGLEKTLLSANEVSKICALLANIPVFMKYSSVWLSDFTHSSGRKTEMTSQNILVKEGFSGMATSSSRNADYCLCASKKSGSSHFICVVLCDTKEGRFTLAKEKIGEAISTYTSVLIAKKGAKVTKMQVNGIKEPVYLTAKEDLALLLNKSQATSVKKSLELKELIAPLSAGDSAGVLKITTDDGSEYSLELTVDKDYTVITYSSCIKRILGCWLMGKSA